jgi:hypothetical protein
MRQAERMFESHGTGVEIDRPKVGLAVPLGGEQTMRANVIREMIDEIRLLRRQLAEHDAARWVGAAD